MQQREKHRTLKSKQLCFWTNMATVASDCNWSLSDDHYKQSIITSNSHPRRYTAINAKRNNTNTQINK